MQVLFAAMLVDAFHPALEDGVKAFNCVGVDRAFVDREFLAALPKAVAICPLEMLLRKLGLHPSKTVVAI